MEFIGTLLVLLVPLCLMLAEAFRVTAAARNLFNEAQPRCIQLGMSMSGTSCGPRTGTIPVAREVIVLPQTLRVFRGNWLVPAVTLRKNYYITGGCESE